MTPTRIPFLHLHVPILLLLLLLSSSSVGREWN